MELGEWGDAPHVTMSSQNNNGPSRECAEWRMTAQLIRAATLSLACTRIWSGRLSASFIHALDFDEPATPAREGLPGRRMAPWHHVGAASGAEGIGHAS
jgi:hypothetical protein